MVHIKGYSFNHTIEEKSNEKIFYLLEKELNFINLFIINISFEDDILLINLFDYYENKKYLIYKSNFYDQFNKNLYQLSSDSKILSYYDGKNILFIDIYKTIKDKKINLFNNTKIFYDKIDSIILSNKNCICLNKNKNFFIIDLDQDYIVKKLNYSNEKLIITDKNNNFLLVENNEKIEIHNLLDSTKILVPFKMSNQKFLLSDNGKLFIIDEKFINIFVNDKFSKVKLNIDKFNLEYFIITIDNIDDSIDNKYNFYISFYNTKSKIINLFYSNYESVENKFNTFEIKIPEDDIIEFIYTKNQIYYFRYNNIIIIYNINQYILLGLINIYLEIEYSNIMLKSIETNYQLKPIISNKSYSKLTMTDIIKNIIKNHNYIDNFTYYLTVERTSEKFMEDIFLCLLDYKEKFIDNKEKKIVVYYELLLTKIIYCYYLECPTNRKNISIFKEGEYNKYKNNNILGYVYIKGVFELLFNRFMECKKILCYSIENSLFY